MAVGKSVAGAATNENQQPSHSITRRSSPHAVHVRLLPGALTSKTSRRTMVSCLKITSALRPNSRSRDAISRRRRAGTATAPLEATRAAATARFARCRSVQVSTMLSLAAWSAAIST
jgi:hypothetical protein